MRRNKERRPSYREPEFEDELDLDEEPDEVSDSDDGEFGDEDGEWPDEDDWDETLSGHFTPENRKLIIGGAAVLILIIVAVIVIFAVYLRNSTNERKAVEAQMNLENLTEEIPDEGDGEKNTGAEADGKADSTSADGEQGVSEGGSGQDEAALPKASEPPAAEVQTEITVGALDDAQDPQGSGAAGNEKSGAEVTVAPRPEGETESLTMGIDVSK